MRANISMEPNASITYSADRRDMFPETLVITHKTMLRGNPEDPIHISTSAKTSNCYKMMHPSFRKNFMPYNKH
jgi:hypothetical protein